MIPPPSSSTPTGCRRRAIHAASPAARALAKDVTFGVEHTPERAVPRDEANRYRRYVSVGE